MGDPQELLGIALLDASTHDKDLDSLGVPKRSTQAASTDLTSIPQEGTRSSEQDMQRDKGTHDHMRETGLTVVTRRSLRALADALRQPASSVLLVRGLELTLALLGKKRETIRKRTNETIRKTNEQTKRKRGHSFCRVTRSILSYEWNYQIHFVILMILPDLIPT